MLTWCCRSPAWCSPPKRPPTRCWPSCYRWPSSPCWAPPASRPGPGSAHETGGCPSFCGSRSTRCTSRRPGSDWPSLGLRDREEETIKREKLHERDWAGDLWSHDSLIAVTSLRKGTLHPILWKKNFYFKDFCFKLSTRGGLLYYSIFTIVLRYTAGVVSCFTGYVQVWRMRY